MLDPAAVLQGLDPEQRRVAEALRGPVRVLAGAGTGKTRAITHRIAHGVAAGVYQPTEVLAVTFTTRAAGEMRGRLRGLGVEGVQARTFHSAALRQLRYFWPHIHGTELPTLTESKLGMLATAASRQRVRPDKATLRDVASEVEWAKVSNVGPDDYARIALRTGRSVNGVDPETIGRLFGSYEEVKRSQSRMDMEDVLLLTAGMLADDERVAAQVRRQYKWFVVDEFQDVSPLQSALLELWLGGRDELCVVGDPAQTIYSFAGADASYLREFPAKYPGTTSIDLVRNYRSSPEVIAAANDLLVGTPSAGVRLVAQRPSASAVSYTPYADEVAEAEAVAAAVERLREGGTPPGEVAVLFRINAQSEAYEEALAARGIPYVVRGAARFFDRGEVREAVTRLRGAARGGTTSEETLQDAVRAVLSVMGWTPEAPAARGQTRDRWESLQALVDQAAEFAKTGVTEQDTSLGAFVDDLDRRASEQHAPVAERRHAGHPPRRQGPRVGRRLRRGRLRGHPPDHLRGVADGGRGGAPPAVRRHHPRPPLARRVLGLGPQPGRPGHPQAIPVPRPDAPGDRPQPADRRQESQGRELPRVRQAAGDRGGEEARPLRRLSGLLRRGAVRGAAHLAVGPGGRGERARVRRVHRCHAAAHRRAQAPFGPGSAAHQRHRADQARPLRRRRAGPRGLVISRRRTRLVAGAPTRVRLLDIPARSRPSSRARSLGRREISRSSENTSKKNCSPLRGRGTLLLRTKQSCAFRP